MSFLLPSCEEIPSEALPASNTISSPKSDMLASEPFTSKRTVEHSSNCEFFAQDIPLSFFLEVAFRGKTYLYPNALRCLRTNLCLNADVSENTLPFVSQSINNFSDYDISQSLDWECPSLSPHVLMKVRNISETDEKRHLVNKFVRIVRHRNLAKLGPVHHDIKSGSENNKP